MKKQWKIASILALSLTFSPAFLASATVDKAVDGLKGGVVAVQAVAEATTTDQAEAEKQQSNVEEKQVEQINEEQAKEESAIEEQTKEELAQGEQAKDQQPQAEAAHAVKNLTIEEALQLARENNAGLKKAALDRDINRVSAEQTTDLRRSIPDSNPLDGSKSKDQARISETEKKAAYELADRTYDVQKVAIELEIKKNYYDVLKAKDLVAVSKAALERAQEQLRQAQVAFEVGTVAKNDVLGAEAMVSSAKARLTAAENSHRLAEITLSRSIGLPTDTRYNLTSVVQYQPMPAVDLEQTIADAQEKRLDIMAAEAEIKVTKAGYEYAAGYSGKGTYDAKQARLRVEQAELKLADTKKAVVSDLTKAYLNIQAAQKQLDAYTSAVEQSKEGLRLAQLRYEVGMATSLEVLTASANLEEMEANRVAALYDYNLAVLMFETAKLAPTGM